MFIFKTEIIVNHVLNIMHVNSPTESFGPLLKAKPVLKETCGYCQSLSRQIDSNRQRCHHVSSEKKTCLCPELIFFHYSKLVTTSMCSKVCEHPGGISILCWDLLIPSRFNTH